VVEIEEEHRNWNYLVTAEHVVFGLNGHHIWARANETIGAPSEVKIPADAWHFGNRDQAGLWTDVAVAPITVDAGTELNPVPIYGPRSIAATRTVIESHKIGLGDEIAVSGLFRSHYGLKRNIPIVRVGNLAMLAAEPVKTRSGQDVEAHLIEARSINGLSGSPVFVNMAPYRTDRTQDRPQQVYNLYLLGLMHGHFDLKNDDVVTETANGTTTAINTGVGVVIPVEKIIEVIFQEELIDLRRSINEQK
jgi:hypothetical protein